MIDDGTLGKLGAAAAVKVASASSHSFFVDIVAGRLTRRGGRR